MNLFRTVVAGSALYLGYKLLQRPTAYPVPIIINLPARRSRQQPRFRAEVPDPTPRRVPSPEPPTLLEPVHPPSPVEQLEQQRQIDDQLDQQADQATIAPLPTETEPTIESPTAAQLLKAQQAVEALIDLEPVQEEVVSYLDRRNQEIARQQQQIQDLMAVIEALEALKLELVPEEDQLAQYAESVSRPIEEMSTKLFFGQVAYPRRR